MVLPVILAAALGAAPDVAWAQELAQEPLKTTEAAAAPEAAQSHIDAGIKLYKKRRFRQASDEFQKAIEADPSSAGAHWYLAYTTYKIVEPRRPFHPDKQKAAALFAKAYELDPTFRPVWKTRN